MTRFIPGKLYKFDGTREDWDLFIPGVSGKYVIDTIEKAEPLVFLKLGITESILYYTFLYGTKEIYRRVSKKYDQGSFESCFTEIV